MERRKRRIFSPGDVFSRLTLIKRIKHEPGKTNTKWLCRCSCGKETTILCGSISNGHTKSCGCLGADSKGNLKHGMAATSIYNRWMAMLDRCFNSNSLAYSNYGGRGITVCERWQKFENFYADMGDPPPGLSLERLDNDGNYCPENCTWDTRQVQANNQRRIKKYLFRGKSLTLCQWSKETGIPFDIIRHRKHRKWSIEKMLTQPLRKPYRNHTKRTALKL